MNEPFLNKVASRIAELEKWIDDNRLCTKDGTPMMIAPQWLMGELKELRYEINKKLRDEIQEKINKGTLT